MHTFQTFVTNSNEFLKQEQEQLELELAQGNHLMFHQLRSPIPVQPQICIIFQTSVWKSGSLVFKSQVTLTAKKLEPDWTKPVPNLTFSWGLVISR